MKTKYGDLNETQLDNYKQHLRKSIFFLLLLVDPNTKVDYLDINKEAAFTNLLTRINGTCILLNNPSVLIDVMSLLEMAKKELEFIEDISEEDFKRSRYRKLILDAGSTVLKIKEE